MKNVKRMKVREFIGLPIDIDVYDNVCEELGIAYINFDQTEPLLVALTQQGYNKFTKILLHQRPLPSAPLELCEGDYP